MGTASLAKVVTGSNAAGGGEVVEKQRKQQPKQQQPPLQYQQRESFLNPRSGLVASLQISDGLMKTSLPTNDTHTFFPETSKAVSMGVPTQYNHLTQDHQSKSWRYEQVMQSMILTKPPRSQYQAAQLDHGTPNTFSSESVATVGQSIPRVFQSQVAGHQARPLLPSQLASRRGPLSKTSPYRGVSCYKRTGRWEAHIWHSGRQVHLGTYSTPAEAARVYDMAAIRLRGWGADLNFGLHVYKDDPELQDLSCLPGSSTEEIDVVKLVQGLKRRRSSAYQAVNTPVAAKVDPPPDVVIHTSEIEDQRPGLDSAGLVDIPLRTISSMYCQHQVDDCSIMDLPESRQQMGSPVEVFVDSTSSQISHSLWNSVEKATSKPQLLVGSMPTANCEPVIEATAGHPPGIPVAWNQDRPCFEKQILLKSAPVASSRVISLGRYPSVQPQQLHQGLYHCGEVNRQLLWSTALPGSPRVSLVVEKPIVPAEEHVLEGKPLSQGHRANSSMIPAFWQRVDGFGASMNTRDNILQTSLSGPPTSGITNKGGTTKVTGRANLGAVTTAPSNGPLQSLTSVLQGAVQGHSNQVDIKSPAANCFGVQGHMSTLDRPGSGSDSHECNPLASDSQERFANLIRLIHELPAKQLVRPPLESDDKPSIKPDRHANGIGTTCSDSPSGKTPFEGVQKLRSGLSHRSAFKTWTSSESDRCKIQNDDDPPSLQDAGSEQSTGVVSDLNNVQASNQCESCSANGVSENAHKIGSPMEETDEITPASMSCSVPSGSQASGAGNHDIMEDDLIAAQELCKLSKILGSGSSNGSIDFCSQTRKRSYPSQVASPSDDFPTWKKKKHRSMSSRDAKQAVAESESHGVADHPTRYEHVLGNSGQANLLVMEGIQQPPADNEDASYVGPVKIDSGVAASCACGGKVLRKTTQHGDWQLAFGSLTAE